MKLGAEPQKVALLGGIVLVGVIASFLGGDSRPPESDTPRPRPAAPLAGGPRTLPVSAPAESQSSRVVRRGSAVREFKPVLKSRRPEDRPDPTTIDPTLHLELLRRLSAVQIEGGQRTIFDFGTAPAPKQPDPPKIIPAVKPPVMPGPKPVPGGAAAAAVKPRPPAIRLKFYGFVGGTRAGAKRAFFLDGEDIFVAGEGDVVQKKYKIVRIGLNSVVVEDLEHKSQQTLNLEEQQL